MISKADLWMALLEAREMAARNDTLLKQHLIECRDRYMSLRNAVYLVASMMATVIGWGVVHFVIH